MGNASISEMDCPTSEGTLASPELQWIGECIGTVNCWAVDTWCGIPVFMLKAAVLIMVE